MSIPVQLLRYFADSTLWLHSYDCRGRELLYQAVDLVMKAGYKEAKSMVEVAGRMVDRIRE